MRFFLLKKKQKVEQTKEILKVKDDLSKIAEYLNDLFSFLPLAICDLNSCGTIMKINKEFEVLSGFSSSNVVGKNLADMFLERAQVKELIVQARKKGIIRNQEFGLFPKLGNQISVNISVAVRRDRNENIIGYFVGITNANILREVRLKMEKEIFLRTNDLEQSRTALLNMLEDTELERSKAEEEKKKTETIFTNFADGLLVFNLEKRLEMMNPKAETLLFANKRELIGKNIEELSFVPGIKMLNAIIKGELKEVFRQELVLGEKLYIEVTTNFIFAQEQKTSFLVILHDITREKEIEQMKSQFVSVAAHQLRTPLSIIKWSLDMMIKGDAGKITNEQKDFLSKTFETNERLIRIINDLLNVARIEEGRYVYQPKILEFNELVEQVFDSLKDLAKRKKLSFKLKIINSEKSKVVKIDVEKMGLAMKNLLENAINYTKPNGEILAQLERKDDHLEFFVKDTGAGIPKDHQPRIFSKFFRSANVIKMETDGSGLGLFIAKNVIEAHGGKIWFTSEENKGTTFFFTLPTII